MGNLLSYCVLIIVSIILGIFIESYYSVLPVCNDGHSTKQIKQTSTRQIKVPTNTSLHNDLYNKIEKLEQNWFGIAGLILTFSGLILVLINLSVYFNFSQKTDSLIKIQEKQNQRFKKNIDDIDKLKNKYKQLVDNTLSHELFSICYAVFRKKCYRDDFSGKSSTIDGIRSSQIVLTFLLSYLYEADCETRQTLILEIFKIDPIILKDLKDHLFESQNLASQFHRDLIYIKNLIG